MFPRRRRRSSRRILVSLGVLLILPACLFWAAQLKGPQKAGFEIILVNTRSEAEEILQLLKLRQPFERLARKRSIDPSAAEGGYLGRMGVSALRPEIRDAVKGLTSGEVTPIVEMPSGYMIAKVVAQTERARNENQAEILKLALDLQAQLPLVTTVAGVTEVENFFALLTKPPNWNQDLQTICEMRRRAISAGFQEIEGYLAAAKAREPGQQNFEEIVGGHHALAQMWSFQGKMDKAIEEFQTAYEIAAPSGRKDILTDLHEKLGIAYLHQGWLENSVNYAHSKICLFPMDLEARFRVTSSSETAIKHLMKYLDQDPSDLEAKWLLNLAYMTLGEYPEGVPKRFLILPAAFESKEDIGRFVDVAPALGLNTVGMSGGAIMEDFDNDGFLDIVTSSSDPCDPMHYFHNNGDGTFTDQTARAGLSNQLGGLNLLQADYNNDGCLDILVLRGAWTLPMRKSLLRNNCDGTFTDVTRESGLAIPATSTQTAAWLDFDNDGNIDLFVGNEFSPAQLFHNNGNGTFTDVARAAGVDRTMFTKGVTAGDYDNDGYPDIYVSNRGENFLYHNNRDGTLTNVARQLHVQGPVLSFPAWFFDYDNDGWLDLFVPSHYASVVEVIRGFLNLPVQGETSKLYRNTGGSFQDVSRKVGLDRTFMPMGANFGDVDNDGYLDFYLGTGAPSMGALVPNVLFRNKEGKHFVDITASSGTGCLHKGHGVALGDINNDGLEDILIEVGGGMPGDKHATMLFKNPGNRNNWIDIRLVGVKTNRAAIGARIKLTLETEGHGQRFIHRVVSSGGSFGASPLQQHIGLGTAKRIETLEIWWPTSNTRQIFQNVNANQFIEIREFEKIYVKLDRRSFSLP